jgi:integrase
MSAFKRVGHNKTALMPAFHPSHTLWKFLRDSHYGLDDCQAVPRWGKNFLKWRIRPVARRLGIPDCLVTFQVMRRTLGIDMQQHGTLKDTQGILRHASIKMTGDIYVQTIERSVLAAVNSRTSAVLGNWKMPKKSLGMKGRNPKCLNEIRRSSAKSIDGVAVSA